MKKSTIAIIVILSAFGLLVASFGIPYYRLHQDAYVEKRVLEVLNQEFDEVIFTHVILYDVLNLETASIPRYSWYADKTSSKYIRPFLASDQEIVNWNNPNENGVQTLKGFIDLNGNVYNMGLNLW